MSEKETRKIRRGESNGREQRRRKNMSRFDLRNEV